MNRARCHFAPAVAALAGLAAHAGLATAQTSTPSAKIELTDALTLSSNTQTIKITPDAEVASVGALDVRFEFQSLVDASGGGGPALPMPAPLPPPILSQAFRTWTYYAVAIGSGIPGPDHGALDLVPIRPKDASQNVQFQWIDADTVILHWNGCKLPGAPLEWIDVHLQIDMPPGDPDAVWTLSADSFLTTHVLHSGSYALSIQEHPDALDELLVSTGLVVSDASQHLVANE
jgi:hypothetical protein